MYTTLSSQFLYSIMCGLELFLYNNNDTYVTRTRTPFITVNFAPVKATARVNQPTAKELFEENECIIFMDSATKVFCIIKRVEVLASLPWGGSDVGDCGGCGR